MTIYLDHSVVCPKIIGRTEYLESLEHLTAQARAGKGQTVLVAGEAGIGKTRLVKEVASRASPLGFFLLQGHCFEPDRMLPYGPVLDLLRSLFTSPLARDAARELSAAPQILPLVPELHAQCPDIIPPPALDPEQDKRRLFYALCQFFVRLSLARPLLMVFEDLHWSDDASLEFLLSLARSVGSHDILLLLTYRADEIQPALARFLAEGDRERIVGELTVHPLTPSDVQLMIQTIFDLKRPARGEFLNTLYELTEGNPFFIEEVLKSLLSAGGTFGPDGTTLRVDLNELDIPRSVEDVVQRRSMQLSLEARQVLVLAAVIGQRFDFSLLKSVVDVGGPGLLAQLKELVAAQLIVEENAGQFAFRHALTRQAIYRRLLAMERRDLHRLIGETIERLNADSLDDHLGDLALHFYQAGAWAKAMDYSRRAGERAQRLYAPRAAAEHLTRALDAARELSRPSPPGLLRARGQVYETLGDFERARRDYENELSAARNLRDDVAEWQSLIDLGSLWASRDYARTGDYFQRALDVARATDDPSTLAHSLNRLGNWHLNGGKLTEALQNHEEALKIFQGLGDPRGIAETMDLLGTGNYLGGDLIAGASHYESAIARFRRMDDRQGLVDSLTLLLSCAGNYQTNTVPPNYTHSSDALRAGEEALHIAREIGWRAGEAATLIRLGYFLGPRGEYAQALKATQEGLAIATEVEHRQWMTAAHCVLGALYLDLLALVQAREHLELALKFADEIRSLHWIRTTTGMLASAYTLQNEFTLAESVLDRASEETAQPRTLGARLCWCARAELELARGDAIRALEMIDALISSPENSGARAIPRLAKLRGDALVSQKQFDKAETVLRSASESAREQGARPWLWRIYISLGKMYRAEKRSNDAAVEFSAARTIIEELAANIGEQALRDHFVEGASALLPRVRPLSPRRAMKKQFGGLTEREREIAALIAAGKSNRAIADALVLSERTVGAHVGSILAKLELNSRTQVATWAIEKGLAKPGSDHAS